MKVGAIVEVRPVVYGVASCFGGRRGRVCSVSPEYMVALDGEPKPLFFGQESLFPASADSDLHMTAGG